MTSSPTRPPLTTVVLDGFAAAQLTRPAIAASPVLSGHPERATTACDCHSPAPCFEHPAPPGGPLLPPAAARLDAPTVCQCVAPDPCTDHPDDRPYLKRPPRWAHAAPAGTVGRLDRAPEPGGVQLEVEARSRLPKMADEDLLLLHRLHSAEMRRRGLV